MFSCDVHFPEKNTPHDLSENSSIPNSNWDTIDPAPETCRMSTEQNHLRSSRVGDVSRCIEGSFDTISLREITQGERRKALARKIHEESTAT